MRISDWSSDVCSSDLAALFQAAQRCRVLRIRVMNVIEQIENEQVARLTAAGEPPSFAPGDTVRVNVKVVEGTRERIQAFEGVCIARRRRGLNSSLPVRKLSYAEGVARAFPLSIPRLASPKVVRRGT